jgi:hypothetical protein
MKTYCTNNTVSFEVIPNEKVRTLIYIPRQRAFQKQGFLRRDKMIIIEGGWYRENDVDKDLHIIKNCKIKPVIPEEFEVVDISKCDTSLRENTLDRIDDGKIIAFKASNLKKYLDEEWGSNAVFETKTFVTGVIEKIHLFYKGSIELKTNNKFDYTQYYYKDIIEDDVKNIENKLFQAITKYPFFQNVDGNLTFIDSNNNENFVHLRFSNLSVMKDAENTLFEVGVIYDALKETGVVPQDSASVSVNFMSDEQMCTMLILF